MGYACPVCGVSQCDAEHLANHLAFTAMLHGGAHEAWLDEHAPGWADTGPDALGDRVVPHAEETTREADLGEAAGDRDRGRPPAGRRLPRTDGERDRGPTDEATQAALAEARRLTRAMYVDGEAGVDGDADGSADRDGGPDAGGPAGKGSDDDGERGGEEDGRGEEKA